MAGEAVPSVSTSDANGSQAEAVGPWAQAMYRINELGTARLEAHNRHAENVSQISEQSLTDARHGANWINQKFGILSTEPNAESAGAEETMKAAGLPELTSANASAAMSSGLATSLVTIQTAQASLAGSMADLKAALIPALQAIATSLAVVQANLAAGAPASGAVKQ